jgi:hypothetical protein
MHETSILDLLSKSHSNRSIRADSVMLLYNYISLPIIRFEVLKMFGLFSQLPCVYLVSLGYCYRLHRDTLVAEKVVLGAKYPVVS